MVSQKQQNRTGRCHLCGYSIDKSVRFPDQRAGTRDHLVPKSEGGRGGRRNIRPAHKGCNERRGTRKIDSILLDEIRTWYIKQYPAIAKLETERQTLKDKAVTHRRWYKFELLKAVEQELPVPSMVRRT